MHHDLKQQAIKLRLEGELGYQAIRERLGNRIAKSTLHEWLKHFPLTKERIVELRRANWTKNQAKIEMFRATMQEKRERREREVYERYRDEFASLPRKVFFAAGLTLYLAEGTKTSSGHVCIANTDHRVIRFHMRWLEEFFGVSRSAFRAALHLYGTMNIPKETEFWESALGLPESQFYKTQIRPLQKSSFSYPESFRHGTCSLNINSVEIKTKIMMAIRAFMDSYLTGA